MTRPFAVFDIDGTVIRWQLYHAIGDRLAKQGAIDAKQFDRVRKARMNWKKRAAEDSFKEYEQALVAVFDDTLKDLKVAQFKQVVGAVFDEYKEQVYTYTRDLIEDLKRQDYMLFALSGSPEMIVDLLARFYGFDDFAGTTYEVAGGRFTGKSNLTIGRKAELLKGLVKNHGLSFENSLGVGDSEGDFEMLALTAQPVAFNPTKILFEKAKAQGWPIVIERKNVVFKLEPSNHGYKLAD